MGTMADRLREAAARQEAEARAARDAARELPIYGESTSFSLRIGREDGMPLTIGELWAVLDELTNRGFPSDTPVQGSSGLSLYRALPVLTPQQLAYVLGGAPARNAPPMESWQPGEPF